MFGLSWRQITAIAFIAVAAVAIANRIPMVSGFVNPAKA